MRADLSPVERFSASLERCLANEDFIPAFYRRFLDTTPEVRARFAKTNFDTQHRLLTRSLKIIGGAVIGDRNALNHLNIRAETHDRHHLDIRPEMYELWRDSMLETAADHDPIWNEHIEEAWRLAINQAIHHMESRY